MTNLKLLNQTLIDTVANAAANSQRLRKNHNFHQLPEPVQRFINIMQPGTYVRPHRHLRPENQNGFEFFLVLQGKVGVLLFDQSGTIIETIQLSSQDHNYGVEIPEGTFHTLVALAPDTALFELKEGPYTPQADKNFLCVFPSEGTPEAQAQLQVWEAEFL